MARVVGVVVCCALSTASADPEPKPAPPEVSWYGNSPPPPAPALSHSVRHVIQRGGVLLLVGGTFDTGVNARLDLGIPSPLRRLPRLRALLVSEARFETGAGMTVRRNLGVTPTLQYAWHLPIELETGELVLVAAAGIRRATLWIKRPDEPFWPSTWESASYYALRLGAGIEYRGEGGLIVSLQPATVGLPFTTPDPPDARWMEPAPTTDFAASLVAGFQFP